MNYFNFLQDYLRLQNTVMFVKLIRLVNSTIAYSKTDKSMYWNNALTNFLLSSEEIKQIEKIMTLLKRNPTIYFLHNSDNKTLSKKLIDNGYFRGFEDTYLFYQKQTINPQHFEDVHKIINKNELKIWLKTADNCYRKNDPQNAYGELGDFLEIAEIIWNRHHDTNRAEFFVAYKKDRPVAVSILTNYKNQGYISCVGSVKEVRGEGYGKAVTLYAVQQSKNRGQKYHYLATEEGMYPHQFYLRIGFNEVFKALGYTKKII